MRADEQVKELFSMNLDYLANYWHLSSRPKVTAKGVWITIEFGTLATVTGRGYTNALNLLSDALEALHTDPTL